MRSAFALGTKSSWWRRAMLFALFLRMSLAPAYRLRSVCVCSMRRRSAQRRERRGGYFLRQPTAAGAEKSCTDVAALADTNVLVYRFDPRFPLKQERATGLLREGVVDGSIVLPYQALVEFVAATTRQIGGKASLLTEEEAHREVDEMMAQFQVVYPTQNTLRTALRGAALYKMSWFDALIWAYADEHGFDPLWSEDFQDGRYYGRVKVQNPFRMAVHEPAPAYGSRD